MRKRIALVDVVMRTGLVIKWNGVGGGGGGGLKPQIYL